MPKVHIFFLPLHVGEVGLDFTGRYYMGFPEEKLEVLRYCEPVPDSLTLSCLPLSLVGIVVRREKALRQDVRGDFLDCISGSEASYLFFPSS